MAHSRPLGANRGAGVPSRCARAVSAATPVEPAGTTTHVAAGASPYAVMSTTTATWISPAPFAGQTCGGPGGGVPPPPPGAVAHPAATTIAVIVATILRWVLVPTSVHQRRGPGAVGETGDA